MFVVFLASNAEMQCRPEANVTAGRGEMPRREKPSCRQDSWDSSCCGQRTGAGPGLRIACWQAPCSRSSPSDDRVRVTPSLVWCGQNKDEAEANEDRDGRWADREPFLLDRRVGRVVGDQPDQGVRGAGFCIWVGERRQQPRVVGNEGGSGGSSRDLGELSGGVVVWWCAAVSMCDKNKRMVDRAK